MWCCVAAQTTLGHGHLCLFSSLVSLHTQASPGSVRPARSTLCVWARFHTQQPSFHLQAGSPNQHSLCTLQRSISPAVVHRGQCLLNLLKGTPSTAGSFSSPYFRSCLEPRNRYWRYIVVKYLQNMLKWFVQQGIFCTSKTIAFERWPSLSRKFSALFHFDKLESKFLQHQKKKEFLGRKPSSV